MVFDTALNIVSEAAIECGLGGVSDVYGSTDSNVVQLRTLLKRLGRDLVRGWKWTHLLKEHSFSTVAGTATYSLPADFGSMVDQTGWNRTSRLELGGPLSAQEWGFLKAHGALSTVLLVFRPWQRQVQFASGNSTPGSQSVAFEYVSRHWVQPSGQAAPTLDAPTANTDTLWHDSELLIAGLAVRFLRAKGFDSTAAQLAYEAALERALGDDSPAPILSLSGTGRGEPLLSGRNVPDTGFGG